MKKRKILIIDDDALIRQTVKVALDYADFEAVTLEEPALAHSVIRSSRPDLILLDLYMPHLNGIELLQKIKADAETAKIPVIIFTGSNEIHDVMGGIKAGAFEYIVKPVDSRLLIRKIRSILKIEASDGTGKNV